MPTVRSREKDSKGLQRRLDALRRRLPFLQRWPFGQGTRWARRVAGVLLVIGGLFGFLPILGFWMIPLGLALLAEDIPPLRRPFRRMLIVAERRWRRARGQRPGGAR